MKKALIAQKKPIEAFKMIKHLMLDKNDNVNQTRAPDMNKLAVKTYYESESSQYEANRPWMESYVFKRIVKKIFSWLKNFDNKVIVNIGCGPGAIEKTVLPNFHNSTLFVSVDISRDMARLTKNQMNKVEGLVADAETLPFKSGSVDAVLSGRAIKFFNVPRFLNQANRVLKDSGSLGVIYDSGDAQWVQLAERLGIGVDRGNGPRTIRTSQLKSKLTEQHFAVQRVDPIASCPILIFSYVPNALYPVLSFFDKPLRKSRFTFIVAKKIKRATAVKKEKDLESMPYSGEKIEISVQ